METIGKYTIVRQIGLGGFGVVYEGTDPFLKRRVAIKTCTTDEEEIRDRFFREAEIAGNLQHRHIVTVHDFGVQDGVPYLVQEYLSGEDLAGVIARKEPLTPERKLEVLLQVARGLEFAHSRGVIHRDVKPANIRVTEDGTVKIMDFGIAKLANVASHLTRTGMTLGTAAYLPPEQIRGATVDHRADLFSFGVLSFELLAYRRPFVGRTISVLFFEILHREPPSLTELLPGCPASLEATVLRCLSKDPEARYPGFGPLIADLSQAMEELQAAPHRPLEGAAPAADAPTPQERPPPARKAVPLTERTTRKVGAESVREATERAARDHRAATGDAPPQGPPSPAAPPGTTPASPPPAGRQAPQRPLATPPQVGAGAPPKTGTSSWGPPRPGAPPAAPSAPPAKPLAATEPRPPIIPARRARRPVPYPPPPPPVSSGVPWALLAALGGAFLLLILAVLFAIFF